MNFKKNGNNGNIRIAILQSLQLDAGKSRKELASRFGMDATTFGRRLDKMKKDGDIIRVVAILDPLRFGKNTVAFIQIALFNADREHTSETIAFLSSLSEVQEVHSTNG